MTRHFWVLIHRWVGLTMAGFLILVGLTGSLLTFRAEIEHVLTPHLFPNTNLVQPLKLDQLAIAAQNILPKANVNSVYVDSSGAAIIGFNPQVDPTTGKAYQLGSNQLVVDSATGVKLAERTRKREGLPTGLIDLMPFIYRLHYNLSLGPFGRWVLGIVALLWTIDCFVAFYLTLPVMRTSRNAEGYVAVKRDRSFWQRWKPAWLIKWKASPIRINFDLHRAGGLWLWLMLLVFAWSSVAFNLQKEVYEPVMQVFFDLPTMEMSAKYPPPNAVSLGWLEAQTVAEHLMQEQTKIHGFKVIRPIALYLQREQGRCHYRVLSSLDVGTKNGVTSIDFDLYTGQLLHLHLPTSLHSGDTVTAWLKALHEADVFGLPYRIFVCILGLVIVMLSVTGIIIWLRKRKARTTRINQ